MRLLYGAWLAAIVLAVVWAVHHSHHRPAPGVKLTASERIALPPLPPPPRMRPAPSLPQDLGAYESGAGVAEVEAFYRAWFAAQGWTAAPEAETQLGKTLGEGTRALVYVHEGRIRSVYIEPLSGRPGVAVVAPQSRRGGPGKTKPGAGPTRGGEAE